MQVDFYHLTLRPLAGALPQIAEKVLSGGERLLVVSGDADQREALDRLLWAYSADSFLPHGQAGEDDAGQPVLISSEPVAGNGARMIAIVDGLWRDGALEFARAFHFFDDENVSAAREAWRGLADRDGVERRYWKQTPRGWEQAA